MAFFTHLKHAKDAPISLVGQYAKHRAQLLELVSQPFSLVLTSSLIQTICCAAGIDELSTRLPEEKDQQIKLFSQVTSALNSVRIEQSAMESLRESFELITLDTSNLKSLSQLPQQRSILGIIPSPDYDYPLGQRMFISGDTFPAFYEQLKSCITNFFTPEAIEYRRQRSIKNWQLGLVTFRFPNVHTCFEVKRESEGSSIVRTYIGLPDIRNAVQKDVFEIRGEIPSIADRQVTQQETVCVYSTEHNQIIAKDFSSTSSSLQNATDNDVLEVNRLTKKLLQEDTSVSALFIKQKQGSLLLLDVVRYSIPPKHNASSKLQSSLSIVNNISREVESLYEQLREDNAQGVSHTRQRINQLLNQL